VKWPFPETPEPTGITNKKKLVLSDQRGVLRVIFFPVNFEEREGPGRNPPLPDREPGKFKRKENEILFLRKKSI
jgi:hypothetical protein